jgi:hypothetical protein
MNLFILSLVTWLCGIPIFFVWFYDGLMTSEGMETALRAARMSPTVKNIPENTLRWTMRFFMLLVSFAWPPILLAFMLLRISGKVYRFYHRNDSPRTDTCHGHVRGPRQAHAGDVKTCAECASHAEIKPADSEEPK